MDNRKFRAALFDLDGVVFDTETQYTVFWGRQFRKYYPENPGMEQLIKGMTLVEIYDKYFQNAETQQHITMELDAFEKNMKFEYVNGFEKFVEDIRSKGVKTAVVTSSNVVKMNNVYSKHSEFKSYFDEILTSEDFDESKPSPDCYQKASQSFGFDASDCVVFEDSFNGLKSGRAADMYVVGLSTTNSSTDIAPLSDIVIADYEDMSYEKMYALVVS